MLFSSHNTVTANAVCIFTVCRTVCWAPQPDHFSDFLAQPLKTVTVIMPLTDEEVKAQQDPVQTLRPLSGQDQE